MRIRFRKASRLILFALVFPSLLIFFQNCGPAGYQACNDGSNSSCDTNTKTSPKNSTSPISPAEPNVVSPPAPSEGFGGSTTSDSSNRGPTGSTTTAPANSTGGRVAPSPGTTAPSFGSGGGGTGRAPAGSAPVTIGSGDLKITQQPKAATIYEDGEYAHIFVSVSGGSYPYVFNWYKDNQHLTGVQYSQNGIALDRIQHQGTYRVEVVDAKGNKVTSQSVAVNFIESTKSCPSGNFYFPTASTQFNAGLTSSFQNQYGTYYLPNSHPDIAPFGLDGNNHQYLNIVGFSRFNGFPSAHHGQETGISCYTSVPGIYNYNPDWDSESGYRHRTFIGSVNFQCRGGKWLFKSNTCAEIQRSNDSGD